MKCSFCGKKDYHSTPKYWHCQQEKEFMERLDNKIIAIAPNGKVYITGGGRIAIAGRGVLNRKSRDASYRAVLRFEKKHGVVLFQDWDFSKKPTMKAKRNE